MSIPKTRQVQATADVSLQQVSILDKHGIQKTIFVFRCGTDTMWSDTMDGMFDSTRRRNAPQWLRDQLAALPLERQFYADGTKKSGNEQDGTTRRVVPESVSDDDLPGFKSA